MQYSSCLSWWPWVGGLANSVREIHLTRWTCPANSQNVQQRAAGKLNQMSCGKLQMSNEAQKVVQFAVKNLQSPDQVGHRSLFPYVARISDSPNPGPVGFYQHMVLKAPLPCLPHAPFDGPQRSYDISLFSKGCQIRPGNISASLTIV